MDTTASSAIDRYPVNIIKINIIIILSAVPIIFNKPIKTYKSLAL
jgi:hypothetical protein